MQFFEELSDRHIAFIEKQPVFFVATAAANARINLSPKGMDSFRVLNPTCCAYLDLTGSGAETTAHIKHDGRITVMFNSFDREPLILRLYGHGRTAVVGSEEYQKHIPAFDELPGARQLIFIDIDNVQTSCGYGVPEMSLVRERATLRSYAERKGPDGLVAYQREKNRISIDGLETGLGKDKPE